MDSDRSHIIAVLLDEWYDVELGSFETDDNGWFQFRVKQITGTLRGDILAGPLTSIRAVQIATPQD